MQRHAERDARLAIRNALTFRRRGSKPEQTGTFLPKPFHKSELILRHMSGQLAQSAQHWTAGLTTNAPRAVVQSVTEGDRQIGSTQAKAAAAQERFHNGTYHQVEGRSLQGQVGWAQITEGAGWYLTHEYEAGFGLPDRRFFQQGDLSEDELERGKAKDGTLLSPFEIRAPDGQFLWAEDADLFMRRRREEARNKALNGAGLFVVEAHPDSRVYADRDTLGWKLWAVIEKVPALAYTAETELANSAAEFRGDQKIIETGLMRKKDGTIVGGISVGDNAAHPSSGESWYQARVWTRDETYVYISSSPGFNGGWIAWASEHDYGEVPAYEAPYSETPMREPHERFLPGLEGAFASVPAFNQVATLLSQVGTWNATPRFVIMLPEKVGGGYLTDARTGSIVLLDSEASIGTNPEYMEVIRNGGKVEQLHIEGSDDLIALLAFYQTQLGDALPSEAARGTGGQAGPAWTTNLLQKANNVQLGPAVRNNAIAWSRIHRLHARILKQRQQEVFMLAAPGTRGSAKAARAMISIKPEEWSLNLSVDQNPNTAEEQMILMQLGNNLFEKQLIDLWQLYEDYHGVEDVRDAIIRRYQQMTLDHFIGVVPLPEGSVLIDVVNIVRGLLPGRVANQVPNAAQALSEDAVLNRATPTSAAGGGGTAIAGINQPAVNASPIQPNPTAPVLP